MKYILSIIAVLIATVQFTFAKVVLPNIISDGMVLQRNSETSLWGHSEPKAKVRIKVSWNKDRYIVQANEAGEWKVKIQVPEAGGPYNIEFNDGDKTIVNNVLIGEVWLCSGQSNMEMPMKGFQTQPVEGAAEIIINAKENSSIRICNIKRELSLNPESECHGKWGCNTPYNVANSSATAYFFAKKVHEVTGLPVGIINSSWGGTPIQAWMDKETMLKFPEIGINALKTGILPETRAQNYPTVLFNSMISPITGYNIKGIIWYQGEANRIRPEQYRRLQPAYVDMMRKYWNNDDMPFYYVQIAPFRYEDKDATTAAGLRESQMLNLKDIEHSGMVVTMDIGNPDCIHPAKKEEVGNRLAYLALVNDYGYTGIDPRSPIFHSWKVIDGKAIVKFAVGGQGLAPLGATLDGFEVAGEDQIFYPATGKILREDKGRLVEITCDKVKNPTAVRYGFKNVSEVSLYNGFGIPASPFRTDTWELKATTVSFKNTLSINRKNEMVELSLNSIRNKLQLAKEETFIIKDSSDNEIPYQITHDDKVIFQVTVPSQSVVRYKILRGKPQPVTTKALGAVYPMRWDDLAWENDLVGFRAYGPSLQERGEKSFGYDLFAKRGSEYPVLPHMYKMETDRDAWKEIKRLKDIDFKASEYLRKSITYHVDHGYGMDCYAVGPTLGAGIAALIDSTDNIIYPWCFKTFKILDNGPLRFTVELTFNPTEIEGNKDVVETRVITLDAGSHFNKTEVEFTNLKKPMRIVNGIVLHDKGERYEDQDNGIIAYVDPTTSNDQGQLYIGNITLGNVTSTCVKPFTSKEKKLCKNALGHLITSSEYEPGENYTYWWGFGWNKNAIGDFSEWKEYMIQYRDKLSHKLEICFE